MIGNASFQRKIIYGLLIVVLLVPVSLISRPSARQPDGTLTQGGVLSRMRTENRISQASLGEVDPTSETMKLMTLGLSGVATNLLWQKANRYKKEEDWDNLTATLNQLAKLQPNFVSVWQFQSWNLAYNVSVEFDDYRSRYHWIKKGIDFMSEGIRYNEKEPVMYWDQGWNFGYKLGKADEYVQYRRLFKEDTDYHQQLRREGVNMDDAVGVLGMDNWLTGRQWFLTAQSLVDDQKIPIRGNLLDESGRIKRGKAPLLFHSYPAKWLMNYAAGIEEQGVLDESARLAWASAGRAWDEYGARDIMTSYGFPIRLNEDIKLRNELNRQVDEFDKFISGLREELIAKKREQLTPEEIAAIDTPFDDRSEEQIELAFKAEDKIKIEYDEAAKAAPPRIRRTALRMARKLMENEQKLQATTSYQEQVNFLYWQLRCEIEQTETATNARRYIYEADQAYEQAALDTMKEKYELAWQEWAKIFQEHPVLIEAPEAEDLYDAITRYQWVLGQLDEPWPPADFPLHEIVEYYDPSYRRPTDTSSTSQDDFLPNEPTDSNSEKPSEANSPENLLDIPGDDNTEESGSQESTNSNPTEPAADSSAGDAETNSASEATSTEDNPAEESSANTEQPAPVLDTGGLDIPE
ncbi:MAG: hypothetical protein KDA87_20510 [Planctomycetales bacterium]|nr:hypothetical protein [Planctomycetales bacterium]